MTLYFLSFILFSVGLYGLLVKRNLIKIIISLAIMKFAADIFFILIGYQNGGTPPLGGSTAIVNPVVQTLVLTSITIGLALIVLAVSLAVRLYEKYGTLDVTKIRRLHG